MTYNVFGGTLSLTQSILLEHRALQQGCGVVIICETPTLGLENIGL